MSDDDVVIGCTRVADSPIVALDSEQRVCEDCGAAVWVASSGVAIIEEGAIPVCLSCLSDRIKNDPDPEFGGITAEQLAEIRATMLHRRRN